MVSCLNEEMWQLGPAEEVKNLISRGEPSLRASLHSPPATHPNASSEIKRARGATRKKVYKGWAGTSTPARGTRGTVCPGTGAGPGATAPGAGQEAPRAWLKRNLPFFTSVPCDWRHLPSQGGVLPGKAEEDLKILSLLPFFSDTLL